MGIVKRIFWNAAESRLRTGFRVISTVLIMLVLYKAYLYLLNSLGVMLYYSNESPLSAVSEVSR